MKIHSDVQEMDTKRTPEEHSPGSSATWETFQSSLDGFTKDIFQDGRDQGVQQNREPF